GGGAMTRCWRAMRTSTGPSPECSLQSRGVLGDAAMASSACCMTAAYCWQCTITQYIIDFDMVTAVCGPLRTADLYHYRFPTAVRHGSSSRSCGCRCTQYYRRQRKVLWISRVKPPLSPEALGTLAGPLPEPWPLQGQMSPSPMWAIWQGRPQRSR